MGISGKYYDGKTSRGLTAVLETDAGWATLKCSDGRMLWQGNPGEIKISPRLGNTPHYLNFSDGGKFETRDYEGVRALKAAAGGRSFLDRVHFMESRLSYAALALVIMLVLMWLGGTRGVPAAARLIAHRLPVSVLEDAGDQTLAFLDSHLFKPSTLSPEVRQRLQDRFQPLTTGHGREDIRILFRRGGPIGPNAFALPNGVIIFTDEMVKLSRHDDELVSVLFHEIGHLVHRHGLRTLIQDSLVGFGLLALTGDASGSAELFMGLPVFLTQMAYSRGFELEADQYALDSMEGAGIPLHRFADLMERLELAEPEDEAASEGSKGWAGYLSTHPRMTERLKPFKK